MSELATTVREALAARDPAYQRFGAAHHRYELAPPIALASVELPDDLRTFVHDIGSGGAGPYYGWLPVDRAARHLIDAPAAVTAWQRALPIAHLGCGYAALVPLDGAARGEVWIDARALGLVAPIRPTFTAFYLEWIDRLAHNAWPEGFVPPGACALASALSGYLGMCERRLGIAAGSLAGQELRDALALLGPGAIEIAAEGPLALFAPGDRVDPCIVCARLVDTLAAEGLRRDVVAPGVRPAV